MKKTKDEWKYVGGHGIWTEYKNTKTGESTIRSFGKLADMPDALIPDCDHYYELVDPHGSAIQCQKCGRGRTISWGMEILRNGQVIENKIS